MSKRRFTNSLLFKIVIAIILGIICSFFFPDWAGRFFATLNGLFGNFLSFFVPVLIFGLITPAIANLGRGAGKWLGITTAIAYGSTVLSGFMAYGASQALYPSLLANSSVDAAKDIDEGALTGYFSVEMPPPFEVMTALLLSFCVGLAMTAVKSDSLLRGANQLREVIMKVIEAFIIPLLPFYIFGIFLTMGMNGNLKDTIQMFLTVLVVAVLGTFILLLLQFILAGALSKNSPLKSFKNMLPAYATALGTSSSAATIPVTYECAKKNGVSESVAGFVIPLCATIHLAGSMMKIVLFAFAVIYMSGDTVSAAQALGFVLMLGVTMIAAPGVPGGAIMAAVGLLTSMLGFSEEQVALMIAAYIAIDSFGTAANVTGDGAIAMIVNRFAKGDLKTVQIEQDDTIIGSANGVPQNDARSDEGQPR